MALDLAVPGLEEQRRRHPGARELHDAGDPGRSGRVDRRALVLDLARDVAAGQEQPLDAVQGPLDRAAVREVADGELHVVAQHAHGLLAIADERAGGDPPLGERAPRARPRCR